MNVVIISKPKISTQYSLLSFLLISFCVFVYALSKIFLGSGHIIINIFIAVAMGVLLLLVGTKFATRYKTVRINGKSISVTFHLFRKKYNYALEDIEFWKEYQIKTFNKLYKQIEIDFLDKKKLILGDQEQENYNSVLNFLNQKAKKKRIST